MLMGFFNAGPNCAVVDLGVLTQGGQLLSLSVYAAAECCNVAVALLDIVTGSLELSENNRMLPVKDGLLGTAELLYLRTQVVDIGGGLLL